MSRTIKKVVKLSYDQWVELLKTGKTTDKDGNEHLYDETGETSYNVYGYDELIALNNRIEEAIIRPNKVYHEQIITKKLEDEYAQIISEYTTVDLTNLSCVGFRAFMKKEDIIKVNGAYLFINGTKVDYDYTCTSDDTELVSVFYFEQNNTLNLSEDISFSVYEILLKTNNADINISSSYYLYADEITTYNTSLATAPLATRKMKSLGNNNFCNRVASNIEEIYSDCIRFSGDNNSVYHLINKKNLKKATFPNLQYIDVASGNIETFLNSCSNEKLEISFPKLKSITGKVSDYIAPLKRVYKVEMPETVENVGNYSFGENYVVILNCKKAIFADAWTVKAPYTSISLCEDWQTSINLSQAGSKMTKEWYIDLFSNKLADRTNETTLTITIPSAIYSSLSNEELALATSKNWTVAYA